MVSDHVDVFSVGFLCIFLCEICGICGAFRLWFMIDCVVFKAEN